MGGVSASFIELLKKEFDPGIVSLDSEDLKTFGRDWTRYHAPDPAAVCFPKSTEEVSKLLKLCQAHHVAVVPSGGRTGLAGGAVAAQGEVVISLSKMTRIGAIDPLALTLEVEAGVVTEAVHEHCKPHGLTWPIDFASKGSSTVGGNIATNAGGVKVIRYGLTRNWVLGLTVVLMNGEILRLNGSLEKNNTGVDLRQVFIGTEGILGVITEAVLKLAPLQKESDVFFFGLKDLSRVFDLFEQVRKSPFVVNAYECLSNACLKVVLENRGLSSPFQGSHEYSVLLEVERPEGAAAQETLDSWLSMLFEQGLVEDAVLAQSPKEAANLWAMREGISESLSNLGLLHKHDISLPIHRLKEFIETWTRDITENYPGLSPFVFGHIGDGNLHINLLKPADMDTAEFKILCAKADANMFGWIQKFEGSVSAEHGIGLLKKHLLKYSRTDAEIALMKQMKSVFDPQGLLNPGKVL
ncbi:MAG: FAD-binding oxidoreductase [Proteobacteria bacterium]|nr:FAD-binding oxidoreductase [Pseudomonadota bacterium]